MGISTIRSWKQLTLSVVDPKPTFKFPTLYWPKFSAGCFRKIKFRDQFSWKYWKNCGFVAKCCFFFPDTLENRIIFLHHRSNTCSYQSKLFLLTKFQAASELGWPSQLAAMMHLNLVDRVHLGSQDASELSQPSSFGLPKMHLNLVEQIQLGIFKHFPKRELDPAFSPENHGFTQD